MLRQYTATGVTVEEAIETACKELGVSPSEVTPEILRLPKKGFFKKVLAEVRVTVQSDEDILKQAEPKPEKKPEPPVQKPQPAPKPQPVSKPVKPAPQEAAVTPVEIPVPAAPAPIMPAEAQKAAAPSKENGEGLQPKMDTAKAYLAEVFEKMGISNMEIRMEQTENHTVLIHLEGEGIGTVIGKRGETLDAVQYLVSLAANRREGEYVRFIINAGNYREKREETLRALAQKMARRVLKTGRPAALEPMNPYERRIIHAVVTEMEGVYSKSTGEEPNRKVVIKPSTKPNGPFPTGVRREGRPGRRPPRPPRTEAIHEETSAVEPGEMKEAPVAPEKKVLDDNVKLYSKIEL